MCPEGHLINDVYDLIVTLLLVLIVFSKQVEEGRKSILIVFQHYPL